MFDRSVKPKPSGKINFSLPEILSYELPNGLKVLHTYKNTLPIVQVNLIVRAGSIHQQHENSGTSYLNSMLLDEGAGNLNGMEIAEIIEHQGSILNINSNKEFTTISLLSLKENLDKSMGIFSSIILSPNFNEQDFDRELHRLQTHVLQLNDDPSFIASTEFQKIIYNSTPYQHSQYGSTEILKNLHNDDIKNFYSKRFFPNNSYLVVVGDITEEELRISNEKYFNSWERSNLIEMNEIKIQSNKNIIALYDKPDAPQSEIRAGHFSKGRNSEGFYARSVLNSILGGQFSSRINLNLREDKGFTYGAHSNFSYNLIGSTFSIQTSVSTEKCVDAINEIIKELNLIKSTISNDELLFSKSYLIRRYPSLFETYSQVAANLSLIPIYNLEPDYFKNYITNIENVEMNDVMKAANDDILLDGLIIVVVGNKSQIETNIKEFASKNEFEFRLLS